MARPAGSKNKPKATAQVAKTTPKTESDVQESLEQDFDEQDELLAGSLEIEPDEEIGVDDVSEDTDGYETPKRAPGMTRVADLTASPTNSTDALLQAFREQTAALTDMMPPKKVHLSKFKPVSSFNPSGRKRNLKYVVYQNGYRCNPKTLSDAEFDLINSGKIRPGLYLSKIVTVRVLKAENPEDTDKIFISYNNKTPDQKLMNKDHWNGFYDLLTKVVAEGEARRVRIKKRQQLEARA